MKHPFFAAVLLGLFAFFAGCQTVESRIREKPDVFANVDKATQDKIKQGIIDIGYTEDMVYLALGKPDEKRERASASGKSMTWIYNTYYTQYDGSVPVGYYRRVYFDPFLKSYRVFYHPAYADIYRDSKEERIRVVFKDGKASVIEQSKD